MVSEHTRQNKLKNVSTYAIFRELQRRADKKEGVKLKENKETFSVLFDKKEVRI